MKELDCLIGFAFALFLELGNVTDDEGCLVVSFRSVDHERTQTEPRWVLEQGFDVVGGKVRVELPEEAVQ